MTFLTFEGLEETKNFNIARAELSIRRTKNDMTLQISSTRKRSWMIFINVILINRVKHARQRTRRDDQEIIRSEKKENNVRIRFHIATDYELNLTCTD